jgi:hypothetical protein
MQWSRLKQQVESLFAPSLQGRVELRVATYRYGHENVGRGIVVVDGRELIDFCTFRYWNERKRLISEGALSEVTEEDVETALQQAGTLGQYDFFEALTTYLALPINEVLSSDNIVISCMAMIDRRIGKRRLSQISTDQIQHPAVRQLYELRCAVEGLSPKN